ncbi:MAG: hypothetical protein IMY73_03425 [Bacteroidetes bacterium]|nr:hypothetical protein [Bacteroidota bacterium]
MNYTIIKKTLKSTSLIIFISGVVLVSCKPLSFEKDSNLIAKVGEEKLFKEDIEKLISSPISQQDSIDFMSNYTEKWIKSTLKKQKAEKFFTDKTIEKMVDDYRTSLLTYKYDQRYTSKVSDEVSSSEISKYYNSHKSNFLLSSPMVKAVVLKVPNDYKNLKLLIEQIKSKSNDAMIDVQSMAEKDELLLTEFSQKWHYFYEVAEYIPFTNQNVDIDKFIAKNRYYQISSKEYIYILSIYESKKTGSEMPSEVLEEQIEKIIINNRRKKFLINVEDSIYKEALINKEAYNRFLDKKMDTIKLNK